MRTTWTKGVGARYLGAFLAVALSLGGFLVAQNAGAEPACETNEATNVAESSGFLGKAESYWGGRFSREAEFQASRVVCGRLTGDRRLDMVVVLGLVDGTGGSPKPFAIFNQGPSEELRLQYVDLNARRLICPSSVRISDRELYVNRPSRYDGAWTVCDRLTRFRWDRGSYRTRGNRTFRRCPTQPVPDLRVVGIGCRRAYGIVRSNLYGSGAPAGWSCTPDINPYTGDTTCLRDPWRKWLKYSWSFD